MLEKKSTDVNQVMEKVLLAGDLAKMEPRDRINYYMRTCESLGVNPMTKPFDLITLNGKMVLYPNRSGTDQLRKIGSVDIQIIKQAFDKDTGCYEVTARAKLPNGRTDEDMGIVPCGHLKGDALANAKLKAVTKAKRRVTLSIMGLGWVDESEVSSIKDAKLHKMDLETGTVIDVTHSTDHSTKPNTAQPQAPGDGSKPRVPIEIANEVNKIRALQAELKIEEEDFKAELYREFNTETMKGLTLQQLQKFTSILEENKKVIEAKPASSPPTDLDPQQEAPWMNETMGPIGA